MSADAENSKPDFDATIQRAGPFPSDAAPEREDSGPIDVDMTIARSAQPVPRQKPDEYVPRIPDVTITGTIGTGGQGVVFGGYQDYLERSVAVKVLHRHIDPSFSKRFQREAKILAGLHHTNIVTCHQAGVTDDDHCYMVMEFIEGPDLFDRVAQTGPLDECDALDLVRDIALALEHGLESSIIHRDVKPQNVLLQRTTTQGKDGLRAKLADLGLARCTEDSADLPNLTAQGSVMGTPTTMAPEQFDAPDDVDHRADIYGLGCVLFYSLTAKPAFEGATITEIYRKKTTHEVPRMLSKVPGLSPSVRELLATMMAPDAKDRPATYPALLEAIARARSGECAGTASNAQLVVGSVLSVGAVAAVLMFGMLGDSDADGTDPESGAETALDSSHAVEGDGESDGREAVIEPAPSAYDLAPPVPAGKSRFPLQYDGSHDFLDGWSGADQDVWMAAEGDYSWVRGRRDASTPRPTLERACPAGEWSLRGHVGASTVFSNSKESVTYTSGVELERGDGLVLRLRAVFEKSPESKNSSMAWTWVDGGIETDVHTNAVDVLSDPFEKAAFDFEVRSTGDRVLLTVDESAEIDVTPEAGASAPFVTLRLFVDSGFGSWRNFEFRGL